MLNAWGQRSWQRKDPDGQRIGKVYQNTGLIVRVAARHATGSVVRKVTVRRVAFEHYPHIPVPHSPPLAVVDLEIRRVGIQGVAQNKLLHNRQSSPPHPPGQLLPVRILPKDLYVLDPRVAGNVPDRNQIGLGCAMRGVDGAVAGWSVFT